MPSDFVLFVVVGFIAQIVDGALGMAYGVVSTTFLLGFGVSPAVASACVHSAEVFTTAASATSHIANRNVEWRPLAILALAGATGGAIGAFVLTSVDGAMVRPFVTAYLAGMGLWILSRAFRKRPAEQVVARRRLLGPLGLVGGFLDSIGGGGWGPTVTTTLVGTGAAPRKVIGTVNAAEFIVTSATSAAFLAAILSGHWSEAVGVQQHGAAIGGLIVGGVLAAPLAGIAVRKISPQTLTVLVGLLVAGLASFQTWQILAG